PRDDARLGRFGLRQVAADDAGEFGGVVEAQVGAQFKCINAHGRVPIAAQMRSSSLVFLTLPLVWYSVTRVSKKFFSFLRKMTSSSQRKGLFFTVESAGSPRLRRRRSAL